jgi:hypothetical protein
MARFRESHTFLEARKNGPFSDNESDKLSDWAQQGKLNAIKKLNGELNSLTNAFEGVTPLPLAKSST